MPQSAYTRPASAVLAAATASVTEPLGYFLQHGVLDTTMGM